MTHRAVLLILTLAVVFGLAATATAADTVPRMDKDTLKSRLGDPNLTIFDVRSNSDWKGSEYKLPGARHLDPNAVDAAIGSLDPEAEYVLYCA